MNVFKSKDALGGLFIFLIGAAFLFFGRNLATGMTSQMGPGYLPRVLSIATMLVGAAIALQGLRANAALVEPINLRAPVLVVLSLIVFALVVTKAGLLVATLALCGVSALANREARWLETLAAAVFLALAGAGLFVWGLGLPLKVLPL